MAITSKVVSTPVVKYTAGDFPETEPQTEPCCARESENILEDALRITGKDRQLIYGAPKANWERTAKIASSIIGHPISAVDCVKVAMAMKHARLIQTPGHVDSMVDLAGYAWVLSEVSK